MQLPYQATDNRAGKQCGGCGTEVRT